MPEQEALLKGQKKDRNPGTSVDALCKVIFVGSSGNS